MLRARYLSIDGAKTATASENVLEPGSEIKRPQRNWRGPVGPNLQWVAPQSAIWVSPTKMVSLANRRTGNSHEVCSTWAFRAKSLARV
jgi:hypothetical protein